MCWNITTLCPTNQKINVLLITQRMESDGSCDAFINASWCNNLSGQVININFWNWCRTNAMELRSHIITVQSSDPLTISGKLLKRVPFCKLIPQMGFFWNNFRHGALFYGSCMQFPSKPQLAMATSLPYDTWKAKPPAVLATLCGRASRQCNWRLRHCYWNRSSDWRVSGVQET